MHHKNFNIAVTDLTSTWLAQMCELNNTPISELRLGTQNASQHDSQGYKNQGKQLKKMFF